MTINSILVTMNLMSVFSKNTLIALGIEQSVTILSASIKLKSATELIILVIVILLYGQMSIRIGNKFVAPEIRIVRDNAIL